MRLPTTMLLYPSMVPLLAHHQVVSYCSLAKPDSCTRSKILVSRDYSYGIIFFVDENVEAEI